MKQRLSQKTIPVQCPVCDFHLRGTPTSGYRCLRCHCHYGTRFIRYIRREQFRTLLHTHFTPRNEAGRKHHLTENHPGTEKIPEKNPAVLKTLSQTRAAIHESTQHLEDFLDLGKPDVLDKLKAAAVQTPQNVAEAPRHRKQMYTKTNVQKKATRKTAARKKTTLKKTTQKKIQKKKSSQKTTRRRR